MKTAMRCRSAQAAARRQSVEEGSAIVITDWRHGDIAIRERATAEPLRGTSYETGLESTLAWVVFDITNYGKEPRDSRFSPPTRATTAIPSGTSATATAWFWRATAPLDRTGPAQLQADVPGGGAGQ